jgi:hypothetical protein
MPSITDDGKPDLSLTGARVCDPQQLCSKENGLNSPRRSEIKTCCGSQSRAPKSIKSF